MLTDYDEWREFISQTGIAMRNQFYTSNKIISLSIDYSFDNMTVYDIVSEGVELVLHKTYWNRRKDTDMLLSPLEKVKLYGKRHPTIFKNKIILDSNETKYIEEYYYVLMKNNYNTSKGCVLDGTYYCLSLFSNNYSKVFCWQDDSECSEDLLKFIAFIKQY